MNRVGAGKDRNSWLIVAWMKRNRITIEEIAAAAGVRHHSEVSHTIHGRRNNRRVLATLQAKGCPLRLLSLPPDMVEAA